MKKVFAALFMVAILAILLVATLQASQRRTLELCQLQCYWEDGSCKDLTYVYCQCNDQSPVISCHQWCTWPPRQWCYE